MAKKKKNKENSNVYGVISKKEYTDSKKNSQYGVISSTEYQNQRQARKKFDSWLDSMKKQQEIVEKNQPIVDSAMRWSMPGAERKAETIFQDLTGYKKRETSTQKRLSEDVTKQASVKAKEIAKTVAENKDAAKASGTKWLEDLRTSGKSTISAKSSATQPATVKTGTGLGFAGNTVTKDTRGTVSPAAGAGKATTGIKGTTAAAKSGTGLGYAGNTLTKDARGASVTDNIFNALTGAKGNTAQANGKKTGSMPYASQEQLQKEWKKLQERETKEREAYQKELERINSQEYKIATGKMPYAPWVGQTPEETQNALKEMNAVKSAKAIRQKKESGFFDDMDDVSLWSQGKRNESLKQYQTDAEEYKKEIEDLKLQIDEQKKNNSKNYRWENLLDLYTTPEVENARAIIASDEYTQAEKAKAQQSLDLLLNKNSGIGSFSAVDKAKNFYKYNQTNLDELRDHMDMDNMRRMAYDGMNGNGAYEQITKGMTRAEKEALDQRIDTALNFVADENGDLGMQLRTAQMKLDNANDQIRQIESANKREKQTQALLSGYELGDTEYHPDQFVESSLHSYWDKGNGIKGQRNVDTVYAVLGGAYDNRDITSGDFHKAVLMDAIVGEDGKSAKDIFMSMYNADKKDEAWAFYKGIESTLNQMYSYYEKISVEKTASQLPVLSSVASLAMTPVQSAEYIMNLPKRVGAWITGKGNETTDPYSEAYVTTRTKNLIRNKVTENLGDWGWAYSGLMSGADSAINAAIGKGIVKTLGLVGEAAEKVVQSGTLALFGTQAFETSLQDNMKKNPDSFAYNLIEAYIDAGIETATEIWSVENWLADPKNLLTYVGKIGFSEASEEVVGAIVEPYVKQMLGHKNEWNERAKQILADGGYTDGSGNWVKVNDADSATRQAMREWNHEIRMSAQGALMSVFPGAAFGAARMAANTTSAGSNVLKNEGALERILGSAREMGQETDSAKLAEKIQEKMKSGVDIGKYTAGKLAQNVIRESGEAIDTKSHDELEKLVKGDVARLDLNEENQNKLSGIIVKALEGRGIESLSKKEAAALNENQEALNLYYNYRLASEKSFRAYGKQLEATEIERKALNSAAEAVGYKKSERSDPGLHMPTAEEILDAESRSEHVGGSREVIYNGKFAKIDGISVVKDGKTGKWQLQLKVGEETVEPAKLQATDYNTAQILRQAAINPEFYSEGYIKTLLEAHDKGELKNKDIASALQEANTARLLSYAGMTREEMRKYMPKSILSQEVMNQIVSQGMEEHGQNRLAQVKEAGSRQDNKITINGTEYGTDAWKEMAGKLDENIRSQIDTIAGIAQRAGIRVDFQSMDDEKLYGSESSKGISINIEGKNFGVIDGQNRAGSRHNMLVTFGHEMTHWLQQHSMQGYNRLEQYVMREQLNAQGVNGLMKRLNKHMFGEDGLSLEDAISEIVADSCDQVLGDEETMRHIQETDGKLFTEIKNFVKDLVARFRKAITGMDLSASKESYVLKLAGKMNEINKIWLGAYDEAISGIVQQGESAEGDETIRHSKAEIQDRYKGDALYKDSTIYDYDFLTTLPDVEVISVPSNISKYITPDNKINVKLIREEGLKNAEQYGQKLPNDSGVIIVNKYTGRKMRVTGRSITHGIHTSVDAKSQANAKAGLNIGKLAREALPINGIKTTEPNVQGTYAMVAPISRNNSVTGVALLTVEIRTGTVIGVDLFDQIHSENTRKSGAGISANALAPLSTNQNTGSTSTSASEISISDFLDIVNDTYPDVLSEDVLNHLKNTNAQGYWKDKKLFSKWTDDENWYIGDNNQGVYMRNNKTGETVPLEGDDLEYYQAYKRGDRMRMEEMLAEKIREAGAIPFKTPEIYTKDRQTDHRWVSKAIKEGDTQAIQTAAGKMAEMVPKNAVLVPMPNHYGQVEEDTDTMILARMIGWITGRPVVNALAGVERESRQEDKKKPKSQQMKAEDLGFRKVAEIPEGTVPYIVDNVIASGLTAEAAHKAMGDGAVTLAYAKSMCATNDGMKRANVTFYDTEKQYGQYLIPLSKRIDMEKTGFKGTKFSKAQLDSEYMDAVKSGDVQAQQAIIDEAASKANYNIKAYHGTGRGDRVGTVFLPERATSGPMAFFTDNREIAENYARDKQDTSIAYDDEYGDYYNQFRVNIKGKSYPVGKLWNTLSFEERQKITEAAKHIKLDDEAEEIIYDENEQHGIGNFTDYERKLHGWNSIDTLIDGWLESGTLFDREEDFLKVLEMAGIKDVQWNNPDARDEKVYDVYLKIQNPFDTSTMYNERFLADLEAWWKKQDKTKYDKESAGADSWDKNSITLDEWLGDAWYDVNNNYTHAWTRIHDAVSDYLKEKGYDGIKDQGGKGGGESHTVWIPFTSEQVKSAEPVTYDDRGEVIPPSERFNEEKKDIRWSKAQTEEKSAAKSHYSRWSADNMDVQAWISGLTPGSLQTEDEATLLQAYKDLRMKISLSLKKQMDYKAKIKLLEGKENLTPAERDDLIAARNRLEIEENRYARLEDEMYRVTSSEGYAGMMYRENMKLRDYIEGKTQDQVRQAVEGMIREVAAAQKQIAKDREEIEKLAQTQAVQSMKSFMSKTSLKKMAGILKQAYSSTMRNSEIEDRLAEMTLKQAAGQDISSDAEALATDLLNKMRGERTVELDFLRGRTLTIGKSLQAELKAENSNLNELKKKLKGSGVTLKVGDKSRLEEQWNELRGQNGGLVDVDGMAPIDQLHAIVDFIADQVEQSRGINQYQVDFDEVALSVKAAVGNIHTYLTNDPAARSQIQELSGKTGDVGTRMEELEKKMDEVLLAGQKAKGWTTVLQRDVADAIKYYNKTAAVAAQEEKTKVRKQLIEQLRSENTKKLMEQRDKYEELMRKDRKARELAQDNATLRNKIHTVASRIGGRLFAETDKKNIPEEAKPLARKLMEMLITNDEEFRHVLQYSKKIRGDVKERLEKMKAASGEFDPETDLDFLVIKAPNAEDNDYSVRDKVWQDLVDIETGLLEYRSAEGQGNVTLADRKAALQKIQEAVSEITTIIQRRGEAFINGKRYEVATLAEQMENEMAGSRFRGERTGKVGRAQDAVSKFTAWGNLTPEYFFKMLKNGVMDLLHSGLKDAENRAGLEALRAKTRVAQIAEETGYKTWDGSEIHKVRTRNGEVDMTTEQIMALYATWKRESNQLRPEDTAHLLGGGFVLPGKDLSEGIYGHQKNNTRPIRMNKDQLNALGSYLTEAQRQYVDDMVAYMSGELAELGNEASMAVYGIKKFTEQFYYPIKSWGGVLRKKSDAGITNKNDNRSMRQSFSKRVKANAANAIEISDFTPTVMNHIVGMINFNTVGPAVENMNKVLNNQLQYGEAQYDEAGEIIDDTRYRKSVEESFRDAYGTNAANYLRRFMEDVNGGMTRRADRTPMDKLLSLFRKGSVSGSLSVAAQQPLSYIRAATMINPVYLARSLSPTQWRKVHDEMLKYSGIAVIKDMGRFDMNQGQSMIDFITPEEMESKARRIGKKAIEATTILPEKMDALTWGRMWVACKLETAAQNKGMDPNSEEFMQKVADRFNDVMRKTQVYDSMMVKSQNMRSQNIGMKTLTSFMAEPTLSLNVLADAVQNFNEKGGKLKFARALTTFLLSAAAQAAVKAAMSSGRSPDDKKRFEEQFLAKWHSMFISEADPLSLIPGYSDLVEVIKNGELADDAWSALGKLQTIGTTAIKALSGKSDNIYRNIEDTVGQVLQLLTNVPAKNLMRDARAIYNFINPDTYAKRDFSSAAVKYAIKDSYYDADNIIGTVNKYLKIGGMGYDSSNNGYYQMIYNAEKAGNQAAADEMREYVALTSKAKNPEQGIESGLKNLVKEDADLTGSEKIKALRDRGMKDSDIASWIMSQYKDEKLSEQDAKKLWLEAYKGKDDNDAYFKFEQAKWEAETGEDVSDSDWFRINAAIQSGRESDYRKAYDELKGHGYKEEDIVEHAVSYVSKQYRDGKATRKETEAAMKKYNKKLTNDDIFWKLDRIDYKNETGNDAGSGVYYRLTDAIETNKSDDIKKAVEQLTKHGKSKKDIKSWIGSKSTGFKTRYLEATGREKTKLEDALTKAYKAVGLTAAEALEIIHGWKKNK